RAGETVELAPRPVAIDALRLLSHSAQRSDFELVCEKGTYVRALARDLAEALGTRGHVAVLRRTAVGPLTERDAIPLADLEAAANPDRLLRPVELALSGVAELRISREDAAVIRNGGRVLLRGRDAPIALPEAWASLDGRAVAIGSVAAGHFEPSRVLLS
ncbi:MAG TPA: tRNA pseudouridine(55) synthase TruB, partial [Devosia sp.]|nr:tRNA pseudouridine(55) synthase TruB [Devosia sp.]